MGGNFFSMHCVCVWLATTLPCSVHTYPCGHNYFRPFITPTQVGILMQGTEFLRTRIPSLATNDRNK